LSATAWLDITVTCAAYDLSLFAAATADTLGTTLLPCLLKHPVSCRHCAVACILMTYYMSTI